jgi:hypothetical protein
MHGYSFVQTFHAGHGLRIRETEAFLKYMSDALDVKRWLFNDQPLNINSVEIENAIRSLAPSTKIDRSGVSWVVTSPEDEGHKLLIMEVGGDEYSINSLRGDFSDRKLLLNGPIFRECIESCHPYSAFIGTFANERALDASDRLRRCRGTLRPPLLRWLHYLDKDVAKTVGGIDHCLMTPVYRVEPFCDGVLFQLTEQPFEADNRQHQEIQLRAMRHLGLEP